MDSTLGIINLKYKLLYAASFALVLCTVLLCLEETSEYGFVIRGWNIVA